MRKASAIQDDDFEKARARMKAGAFEVKKILADASFA